MEIRPIHIEDIDHIMTWVNDFDVVGKFEWYKGSTTREQELQILEKIIESNDKVFSVFDDNKYIGQTGLHDIKEGSARLSIVITKENWHNGYGHKTIDYAVREAFKSGILEVWATPREENQVMRHLLTKSGFRDEGFLDEPYTVRGENYRMCKYVAHKEDFK